MELLEGLEEDVLGDVLGVFAVLGDVVGSAEDLAVVLLHKDFEGGGVAGSLARATRATSGCSSTGAAAGGNLNGLDEWWFGSPCANSLVY